MKALIKKALWTLGYEIRRCNPSKPQWPQPDSPAPTDEVLAGPWFYSRKPAEQKKRTRLSGKPMGGPNYSPFWRF
jgi:hypothetical protein